MAVLQKIRSKGVLLVSIIAVALFLFVAGDLFRGLESIFQNSSQVVGEVNGISISIQDFQKMVDNHTNFYEIMQQRSTFDENEQNRIKDEVWQNYVQTQLIERECDKLGISVTDEEVSDIIRSGFHQMLQVPVFMSSQTGRYDFAQVSSFLNEYKSMRAAGTQVPDEYEKIYQYYLYAQHQIRNQILAQKYQTLISQCLLSNPSEAKLRYDLKSNEATIALASFPVSSVNDSEVSVSDEAVKARYNERKDSYKQMVETRDIKMIDVQVTASEEDRTEAEKEMAEASAKLVEAASNKDAGVVVRQASSLIPYADIYKTTNAYPTMIASAIDSARVGEVCAPAFDPLTGAFYTFKVLGKATMPDSVLFRQLAVVGKDETETASRADSVVAALRQGEPFKNIAQKYSQTSDSAWVSTSMFENVALDADNASFLNTLFGMRAGEVSKLKLDNGGTVVLQVLSTANPVTKYNVAAVVKSLTFSDETYRKAYNGISSFLASNKTLEQIEANAVQAGYTVRTLNDVTSSSHGIAGIRGTRDALKWVFDEAEPNDVSHIYECGTGDHILLVALTGVNKIGLRSFEKVSENIKSELLNEAKLNFLADKVKDAKTLEEALSVKGAESDTVRRVTFNAPAFIPSTATSEPMVSAAAAGKKTTFAGPVKGERGVYMIKVLESNTIPGKFDEKAEATTAEQNLFAFVSSSVISTLYQKANVVDRRYKFF